jgi:glycosyltransferase involved in cell wall biosynthesis
VLQKNCYPTHNVVCGSYSIKKKSPAEFFRYALEIPGIVRTLDRLVSLDNITLLYVNGPRLLPPAAWVARRHALPIVFHCHNRLLQNTAIALTGEALRRTGAYVIACCQYAADPLRKYVRPERFNVIFNGVEEMALGKRRSREKLRRIGVVGRVEMEKGQIQFVQAARLILQKIPDCTFVIVGVPMFSDDDYYQRVVASSHGLPLEFLDWRDDIKEVYADLDLLVVPSSVLEATTRVILEAYSAGIPVVAFPCGGIPEILKNNQTGFSTDDTSAEALAQRILSVVEMEPRSVATVVARAREEWRERYTIETYQEDVCHVLAQAAQSQELARHGGRSRRMTGGRVDGCQDRKVNPEVRAQ